VPPDLDIAGTLGHRDRRSRGLARRVAVGHGDVLDAAPDPDPHGKGRKWGRH